MKDTTGLPGRASSVDSARLGAADNIASWVSLSHYCRGRLGVDVAETIGVSPPALNKAIRLKRDIVIALDNKGDFVASFEWRPFPARSKKEDVESPNDQQ